MGSWGTCLTSFGGETAGTTPHHRPGKYKRQSAVLSGRFLRQCFEHVGELDPFKSYAGYISFMLFNDSSKNWNGRCSTQI